MNKVHFTHSYFYRFDPKQWAMKQPYPPLATIQAAAVIREAGFPVSFFDTNLREEVSEIKPVLEKERPRYLVIYDDGFNYLSKMCLTNMREAAFQQIEFGKAVGCTIIVSSSDSTDRYKDYLDRGADFIVRGEGEETLRTLLIALERENDLHSISGLAFRKGVETILTGTRPVLRDLDSLPLPAWDLIDMDSYRKIWLQKHGYFSLNLATTRGCPYKCNWCAKPIYGNRYNSRSPQHVVAEIVWLLENHKPDHFWMCDDIFGLKPGWVEEFCSLIKSKALHFRYKIQSRVDLLLEENTVDSLVESRAETIWVGAESGSQKILDAMDKGTTVTQIYQATRLLKRKGIRVGFFLQFGYPGETRDDINATLKMVLDLLPDEVGISISYPLPGTKFYEKVKGQLKEKKNWSDSDDLALLFESTFPVAYYRELHRYIHCVYRKHKGFESWKKLLGSPMRLTYRDLRSGLATFYYLPTSFIKGRRLKRLESV
jgi:anaerobic magnesium-protoporphyrin IX monomethyl ester cyclase